MLLHFTAGEVRQCCLILYYKKLWILFMDFIRVQSCLSISIYFIGSAGWKSLIFVSEVEDWRACE